MAGFTTHWTNKDRSIIYKTSKSKIKNNADVYSIPKREKQISERQKLIERYLKRLKATKSIYCPALNAEVTIKDKGINESGYHSAKSVKSTIVALNLKEIIENAKYIKKVPKKRSDKSQRCFKCLHLLVCAVENVGYAKLVIGEFYEIKDDPSQYTHYCVTHMSLKKVKA